MVIPLLGGARGGFPLLGGVAEGRGGSSDFSEVFSIYAEQVRMGVGIDPKKLKYDDPRFKIYNDLQADAARFAAHREAQRQRELDAAPDATEKAKIEARYKEYLKTEKQGIFANSAAAERWAGFQENTDIYPNLEWRTAGDSDVRPEHARLDGLTLPVDDPFWNKHTPPLGFGCRCELIQTDKKVTKTDGYDQTTASKGFDFNPGIDHKIFSDTAGYYTSASKDESKKLSYNARCFIGNISRDLVRKSLDKAKIVVVPPTIKSKVPILLSNTDIDRITSKNHDNQAMRNALMYDIEAVVKDAEYIKSIPRTDNEPKHAFIKTWHYYKVKGFDKMYLIFKTLNNDVVKFHSIGDRMK